MVCCALDSAALLSLRRKVSKSNKHRCAAKVFILIMVCAHMGRGPRYKSCTRFPGPNSDLCDSMHRAGLVATRKTFRMLTLTR